MASKRYSLRSGYAPSLDLEHNLQSEVGQADLHLAPVQPDRHSGLEKGRKTAGSSSAMQEDKSSLEGSPCLAVR